ncbi:hypothetical protein COO91_01956 [Nostoc flagelliforme CCNUN1]|uniref:Uncharacterized protein n=1 Tax=Nostoc flagelliforme CCNUN1 TaxID=2038116 RepID=A0A2K8SKX0_9NOSO|nr:hypothetical protein [Nostoc flagelliforme]AUB36057.1 hypothetical protein COO91_01956 [Nostoc flagelliforme CCNUN1]
MFSQSGLFDIYASYHRFGDRIAWDSETGKVYVGMQNKEASVAWEEYLLCDCILPAPLQLQPAEITCVVAIVKCRHELVGKCTQEEAIAAAALDFSKAPPTIDRPLSMFSRGSVVKVLFTWSGGFDKRIGKIAVVERVDTFCDRLEVSPKGSVSKLSLKPSWVVKIGEEELPPVTRWEIKDTCGWIEHHLFGDGKKSRFHVGKAQPKSYGRQVGIPEGMEFALFESGQMVEFFVELKDAKAKAEELL